MIDLLASSAVDRETEVTYIRKERDWVVRAIAEGRPIESDRLLPVLPPNIATRLATGSAPDAPRLTAGDASNGNGHSHGTGGHARHR
jgi:hypothetical protein